ncbi:hypothetical protein U1Q18_043110 [Sarracenia purpurea var. burkii]
MFRESTVSVGFRGFRFISSWFKYEIRIVEAWESGNVRAYGTREPGGIDHTPRRNHLRREQQLHERWMNGYSPKETQAGAWLLSRWAKCSGWGSSVSGSAAQPRREGTGDGDLDVRGISEGNVQQKGWNSDCSSGGRSCDC